MSSGIQSTSRANGGNFWTALDPRIIVEGVYTACSLVIQTIAKIVHWIIENRGGFALLVGFLIVPSQFLGLSAARSNEIIAEVEGNSNCTIERFNLDVNGTAVNGIIYYPQGWDPSDKSRCILYHNPNAITVAEYFYMRALSLTPGEFLKWANCPIILYDYRGTGLSHSAAAFWPTYESVVVDGERALDYALGQFQSVKVVGSSLGGGVGTASLERRLSTHPEDANRVSLINHDSFSTTPRVVLPQWPIIADWTGWVLGGLMDAETPMRRLIERNIPITVLCHRLDGVIPDGAKMAEVVESVANKHTVTLIYSPEGGHAYLSKDMMLQLGCV